MTKNGWIACIIVVIVFLCALTTCLLVSLTGLAGYFFLTPSYNQNLPVPQADTGSPFPTPGEVLPSPELNPSPPSGTDPASPKEEILSPEPESTATDVIIQTDTIRTLDNTFIPVNDPIDLASRLLGLHDLSATKVPVKSFLTVGAKESFWAGNGDVENFQVNATLQYVTGHAYFWIEDGIKFRVSNLRDLADAFENQIYPTNRAFFGSEWTPGIDGDPHIYIVYAHGLGDDIAGYYSSSDEYPKRVNRFSNGHELFLINADNSPLDDEYTYGILAHELQHMIQWYQDQNEATWISEGFSEMAVLLNHYYSGGFDALYTSEPDLQLNDWPSDLQGDTTPHYGASFLFLTYFLDRFGESATKDLAVNPENDLGGVDSTLQQIHAVDPLTGKQITVNSFYLDWAITNYLMDKSVGDGRYSYSSFRGTPRAEATETVYSCPIDSLPRDVHQFGVDYIRFNCRGRYNLHFTGYTQTHLLPQDPHSGQYAFWSNKNDESDTWLTRTFDLSSVHGQATLSYWTWYDIENGWDYVYLEATTDGKNWQILLTPSGTSDDPQGYSYGWGYTGASGGGSSPIWIQETVDLSAYAGKTVSLRFEYVTDSNVTGEGFLLDDLAIPEINYFSDFEADPSGWQSDGWARVQNLIPQSFGLALISVGETTSVQYVALNPDNSVDIPFTIGNGVDHVVLVVTGTTHYTRQLAPYHFSVTMP